MYPQRQGIIAHQVPLGPPQFAGYPLSNSMNLPISPQRNIVQGPPMVSQPQIIPLPMNQVVKQFKQSNSFQQYVIPVQQQPPQLLPLPPQSNDTFYIEQELNKARYRVAELEKQLILAGPEVNLWKQKFNEKDQEVQRAKVLLQQPTRSALDEADEKIRREKMLNSLSEKEKEVRNLTKINQQLQEKLLEVIKQRDDYPKNNMEEINSLRFQISQKDQQLADLANQKLKYQQQATSLNKENEQIRTQIQYQVRQSQSQARRNPSQMEN